MKKIIIWEKWKDVFQDEDQIPNKIVIPTPIGMISHKIGANANGELNFMVGDTNFDLEGVHCAMINNVPGVEIFTLYTSYKFRICIGKAFSTNKVLRNIEIATGCHNEAEKFNITDEQRANIKKIKADLSGKKFWAIYILPNGKFEYCFADDNKEFIANYQFFLDMKRSIGGRVLSTTQDKVVY